MPSLSLISLRMLSTSRAPVLLAIALTLATGCRSSRAATRPAAELDITWTSGRLTANGEGFEYTLEEDSLVVHEAPYGSVLTWQDHAGEHSRVVSFSTLAASPQGASLSLRVDRERAFVADPRIRLYAPAIGLRTDSAPEGESVWDQVLYVSGSILSAVALVALPFALVFGIATDAVGVGNLNWFSSR